MKLVLTFFTLSYVFYTVKGECLMYGECYEVNGHPRSCIYNGPAHPVFNDTTVEEENELLNIIENRCPQFLHDEDGNRLDMEKVVTCCDPEQIRKMADSLLIAEGVLGRCPTCMKNFVRQICEMNCSPDQSRFVEVFSATSEDGIEYVEEINYRLYNDFMLDAHASCAGVLVPQTGIPAINLMCGNAPVCDADAWFGFTGNIQQNPMAPVQVNFLRWPTKEDSMHVRAPPCNETIGNDLPCSCIDCLTNCPIGNEPSSPELCTIGSVNCIGVSIAIVCFIISILIFAILTFREYKKFKHNVMPKSVENRNEHQVNSIFITFFQNIFSHIGALSARNPIAIIMITSWIAFAMVFGVLNLNLTSKPIELWSAPESRSRQELNYFNSRFGPFYRAAQVFLTFNGLSSFQIANVTYGPAFNIEALKELISLEDAILNIGRENSGVTLEKVCYAPLRSPGSQGRLDQCVLMSASLYLGDDRNNINNATYLTKIQNCLNNHYSFECLASWGGGAEPEITFGGYDDNNILSANTLLLNFPIANHLLEENLKPVLEWEQQFIDLLQEYESKYKPDFVEVAYGTERSIEDEIERVSKAEIIPIAISYVLMFIYVTVSLGNIRYCKTYLIDSKILVSIGSIVVVVIAIFCAMGVMGYTGFTTTLLAINVIPFFVLSIGIDNVFLMVNTLHYVDGKLKEYDDYNENFNLDEKTQFVFSKMMSTVGPSMFVSSITQITCFAIGTLANFPAVVTFAIFATFSLAFLFIFQITTVVAILALDYKRTCKNRFDVLFCIQQKILDDTDPLHSATPYQSITQRVMEPYCRFILKRPIKLTVIVIFTSMVFASIIMIPQIEIGLDQELALPPDSYVYKYLQAVNHLLRIGPPVYFVLKAGLNFTDQKHQNTICSGQLCFDNSLTTQIFLASQFSNVTYIAKSSNSWLDDFFDWSTLQGACCKYNITDGSFCPSEDNSLDCAYCSINRTELSRGLRPDAEAFSKYIPFFLQDPPTEICNKAGLASYYGNVNYVLDAEGRATVEDSNFMAYHVPLGTSKDYITALKYGYEVAENITASIKAETGLDVEVFAYSVFYVFYEQYLTMWGDTFKSIGYCLIGALVFNLLASGFNFMTTFAVMFTALLVVVNMMGVMYVWNIPLNAVSCVNLIVSIGISVEFCSHIAYAFATSKSPPEEKVEDALKQIGATVITGITFTNIPIIVLAFSYTEIIEVFFFRMFFSLVVLGFLHGMVFFPVLLSYLNNLRRS